VAIDGSDNALRAVGLASRIARNNNAELLILHVMVVPSSISGNIYVPFEKIEEKMRASGEQFLAVAAGVAKNEGIEPRTQLVEGFESPASSIAEYSQENNVDLIVVGTRGLGGFKRLLLGSVASAVVHYAHCSVLVVR
jgi:nucleotide-binding universal stress UspA family protein